MLLQTYFLEVHLAAKKSAVIFSAADSRVVSEKFTVKITTPLPFLIKNLNKKSHRNIMSCGSFALMFPLYIFLKKMSTLKKNSLKNP